MCSRGLKIMMTMESQDVKDFEAVKEKGRSSKRRHSTRQNDSAHVSAFIKSALAPPHSDTPHTSLGVSKFVSPPRRRRRMGEQSGCSRTKKKGKLGGWDHIKWPGDRRLDTSDSDASDIQSYSDEDTRTQSQNPELDNHEEISSDETEEEQARVATNVDVNKVRRVGDLERSKKWRLTMDLLQTSTPVQKEKLGTETTTEFIADFESPQSSPTNTPSPHHQIPILTAAHSKHPSKRSFTFHSDLNLTPDNVSISTPPSSPEGYSETEDTLTRPKTSDWLKQVSLDSDATRVVETSMSDTFGMITPHDSAKKLGRRRGRRRFVEGGMAEQLEKIVQRENVEVTFWEHKVKQLEESDIDMSSCLTVCVLTLTNCYSLFLANCHLLQGKPSSETTPTCSSEVSVLFSTRCARSLNLRVGSIIRIHPPWQCLRLPSLSQEIVLCALFCQSVGHTPTDDTPTSPVPSKHRGVASTLNICSPLKSPLPISSCLTRSPSKSLQLSKGENKEGQSPDFLSSKIETTRPPTTSQPARTDSIPDHPLNLLDGIEHAQYGVVMGLTGRVVKVYRRKLSKVMTSTTGESENKQSHYLHKPILHHWRSSTKYSEVVWCLLVCDATGMYAEIQLYESDGSKWSEMINCDGGMAAHFTNLRIIRRTNGSRNPDIFSLISSLTLVPPKTSTGPHSPSSQDSVSSPFTSSFQSTPPAFCYLLQTTTDSQPHLFTTIRDDLLPRVVERPMDGCVDAEVKGQHVNTEVKGQCVDAEVTGRSVRQNLLGRVVYYSNEHASAEDPSTLQLLHSANCGGYLHIVTSTPSTTLPTHTSTTLPTHSSITLPMHTSLVMVYLKPSFPIIGLDDVLSTCGTNILLRDVCCDEYGSHFYSMDACSMIITGCTTKPMEGAYPVIKFTDEEVASLNRLRPPNLPVLDQDKAAAGALVAVQGTVVDVDEENAYSWPACDMCGSEQLDDTSSELYCDTCQRVVSSPNTHVQLAVFIKYSRLQNTRVLVKLLQSTINGILLVSTTTVETGFDIHCVLSKWLQLESCRIQEVVNNIDGTVLLKLSEIDIRFTSNS